jgi:methyl-accepting chemotaxis protein
MEALLLVAAIGAAAGAAFLIASKVLAISRGIVAVHTIIRRELTPNSGSSMKDQVSAMTDRADVVEAKAEQAAGQTQQTRELLTSVIARMERISDTVERVDRRSANVAADVQELAANSDREHADMWATLGEAGFDRRRRPSASRPPDGEDGAV